MSLLLKALENAAKNREAAGPQADPSPPSETRDAAAELSLEPVPQSTRAQGATRSQPQSRNTTQNTLVDEDIGPSPHQAQAQSVLRAGAPPSRPGIFEWFARRPLVAFSTVAGIFAIGYGTYLYLELTNPGIFVSRPTPVAKGPVVATNPPPAQSPAPPPSAIAPVAPVPESSATAAVLPSPAFTPGTGASAPPPAPLVPLPLQLPLLVHRQRLRRRFLRLQPGPSQRHRCRHHHPPGNRRPQRRRLLRHPLSPQARGSPSHRHSPKRALPRRHGRPGPRRRVQALQRRRRTASSRAPRVRWFPSAPPCRRLTKPSKKANSTKPSACIGKASRPIRAASMRCSVWRRVVYAEQDRGRFAILHARARAGSPQRQCPGRLDQSHRPRRSGASGSAPETADHARTLGIPILHAGQSVRRARQWAPAQQAYFQAHNSQPDNPDYAYNLAVGLEHLSQPQDRAHLLSPGLPCAVSGSAIRRRESSASAA